MIVKAPALTGKRQMKGRLSDDLYLFALSQFVPLQFAVAIGIDLLEPLGQGWDVATLWIADEFLQCDRSVPIPVAILEELILRLAFRRRDGGRLLRLGLLAARGLGTSNARILRVDVGKMIDQLLLSEA